MLIPLACYLYNMHFSLRCISIPLFGNDIYLLYEQYNFTYSSSLAVPVYRQIFAVNATNLFLFHHKYVILIENTEQETMQWQDILLRRKAYLCIIM